MVMVESTNLSVLFPLNKKHRDFCFLRKYVDGWCIHNSTAAVTPVVPNQQELTAQHFLHLNTEVNNPLLKTEKHLKKFRGLLSGGILVFNNEILSFHGNMHDYSILVCLQNM